ncbi:MULTISPECIES: uracil-DNA glycosylase family protein [unclassified Streptococcus]|uniref:uracil-DNA glycosylase family protein n=1 Tax=unclassified Streptococcus TaxID=2608887 RepID=UPI0010717BDA|nr:MULTISPECIES: uracil-DNA glycosylase family protein [unclassified Streptococcus]MBF0786489.1 uracil-DNA glycosylase family protein [Streptococcus sp. 19428wC2_LYSM12]MCQ9212355.1 uracil-DNA glycosylase family protein [Streptococcus sp. B01]MCQ9213686.1 uracil-DNA glycosylase family protein [Streptococcus sp. O1]TFV06653.1 uracil-DNA glycosylase family protein [Streptococcus sp. LYSM12]
MPSLANIRAAIMDDPANQVYTKQGIKPLFQADCQAKILLVGQAPGLKAQERQLLFADPSGDNLRAWLGVNKATFYNPRQIAILPMDFYYPGRGKSGDVPPRKDFAAKWHPQILDNMPQLELVLLIGQYAQDHYLKEKKRRTLTATVRSYKEYLPQFFPLVHPSPRNNIWQARNPWFKEELVPALQKIVKKMLSDYENSYNSEEKMIY